MPKIHVEKGFNLLLSHTERLRFEPGVHDVSDEVADHWFTKQHLAKGLGTAEFAAIARAAANTAKQRLDAAQADYDRLEGAAQEAEALAAPAEVTADDADLDEAPNETGENDQAGQQEQQEPSSTIDYEALTDEELRALLTDRLGRAPHWKAGRPRLLELACGAEVTADDAE